MRSLLTLLLLAHLAMSAEAPDPVSLVPELVAARAAVLKAQAAELKAMADIVARLDHRNVVVQPLGPDPRKSEIDQQRAGQVLNELYAAVAKEAKRRKPEQAPETTAHGARELEHALNDYLFAYAAFYGKPHPVMVTKPPR